MKTQFKIKAINLMAASLGNFTRKSRALRVLTFHNIDNDSDDLFAVSKSRLGEYLSLLSSEGYKTIRACDLISDFSYYLNDHKTVLLTFDDGYISAKDIAAELLVKYGMTATFFVISSMTAQSRYRCYFSSRERLFLSSNDLEQMFLSGFEIGSHSHTHVMLGMISQEQIETEVLLSKRIIEDAINHDIVSFAYPFGQKRSFSPISRFVLEENGFLVGFSQEGTRISSNSDLLKLSRTSIDRFDTVKSFRRKLEGDYDFIGHLK